MAATVQSDPRTGSYRLAGTRTALVNHANRYLEALTARGLSPLTLRSYAYALARFLAWFSDCRIRFKRLAQSNLVAFVSELRQQGAKPSTINHRLTVVRSFYEFVCGHPMPWAPGTESRTDRPPFARSMGGSYDRNLGLHWIRARDKAFLRVKMPRKVIDPLTPDQVDALLRRLDRYRDLAIVYMMLLCGLRSREVLGLKVSDITPEDRCFTVSGKGGYERVIPLPQRLQQTLASYLRFERPRGCSTSRLFVVLQGMRRGEPMTPSGLRSLFRRRRLQPRLANANPHRMRHTFGADMARAGMSIPVLQRIMGHAYPETTMRYVQVSRKDVAEAYNKALEELERRRNK